MYTKLPLRSGTCVYTNTFDLKQIFHLSILYHTTLPFVRVSRNKILISASNFILFCHNDLTETFDLCKMMNTTCKGINLQERNVQKGYFPAESLHFDRIMWNVTWPAAISKEKRSATVGRLVCSFGGLTNVTGTWNWKWGGSCSWFVAVKRTRCTTTWIPLNLWRPIGVWDSIVSWVPSNYFSTGSISNVVSRYCAKFYFIEELIQF